MAKLFKNSYLWNQKPMTYLFSRFYIGGPFAVKLVVMHIYALPDDALVAISMHVPALHSNIVPIEYRKELYF